MGGVHVFSYKHMFNNLLKKWILIRSGLQYPSISKIDWYFNLMIESYY